jgi:von Willebrand factor type D domain
MPPMFAFRQDIHSSPGRRPTKSRRLVRAYAVTSLGAIIALILLFGLPSSSAMSAQPEPSGATAPAPSPTPAPTTTQPQAVQSREAWRATMSRAPLPKQGCFTASYPSTEWHEVPCKPAPERRYLPADRPRPQIVGGEGTDWTAQVSGAITGATGSFDNVTGVTSVASVLGTEGSPDNYSLQLNTNHLHTPLCDSGPNPSECVGIQQFVFSNSQFFNTSEVFIQYWLFHYGTPCPADWHQYEDSCSKTTLSTGVPFQSIANLGQLSLKGIAGSTDTPDAVKLFIGGNEAAAKSGDNTLNLPQGWQVAEFNVFGDGDGSQAVFNDGATIVVRTGVDYEKNLAPSCELGGTTGESNSLDLVGTPSVVQSGPLPSIVFTESNVPGGPLASCATSIGETHLTTFDGLLYDFQATGDFLLAAAGSDFVVQTRQALVPNWPNPNVSANQAVATRMGKTRVAVCLGPTRLEIDGKPYSLGDGQSLSLPDQVRVLHIGNVYLVRRQNGEAVRAEINSSWINVSVDAGHPRPANVRGLLGNANGKTGDDLATRDGSVLQQPVSFADLYHRFAESWRVPPDGSILCKGNEVKPGIPKQPFYANDLGPDKYERARATCVAEGIKGASLLDACTLDVAVLGSKAAARGFIHAATPISVMHAGSP